MNIWDHSRLSVRKFGGVEQDYFNIHKFFDSSKLFYYHVKHRLLLHNLYGVELATRKFGDFIVNADGTIILVRDIAVEHLKEDLSGKVPGLNDWLMENDDKLSREITLPMFDDPTLEEFVLTPLIRSNLKSSLLITLSDFGIYLTNELLGLDYAKTLSDKIEKDKTVKNYLEKFSFTARWQFCPDKKELDWLKTQQNGQQITT
ncbi:MAG: hypothetical protein KDD12_07460 [Lewinella sp.]|nr:hypothetical protein [Lewinella sp.]